MTAVAYNRPWIYAPPRTEYAEGGIDLIYHDEDVLIISKPSGLLTVPGKADDMADCLEARVRAVFNYARIVHRLDMDTSGVMVMARHYEAQRELSRQFEHRKTQKTYIADVDGIVEPDRGRIEAPMRCDWPRRPLQMIDYELGKPAITDWEVVNRTETTTRLRLKPITGRSHQLRVHLLSIGHPILGDRLYAPDNVFISRPRLHLHALSLSLTHPGSAECLIFESPCPFDFGELGKN